MPIESLFAKLEPLLPTIQKPIQYVGGELNSTTKDWDSASVRWALMYPDAYEVGLPNQGLQILYEILNERDWILAERTYAVFADMEQVMRDNAIPQFTVDGHRPVGAFDLLGISFATELGYTNMLTALDLAGIPLHAVDRDDTHPIVIAGGHSAFNPEPVADFIDAAVLGDGEEIVLAISDVVREWKDAGQPRRARRGAVPAGRVRRGLRAQVLRRRLPAGRSDQARRAEPVRCPVAGAQAHPDGPRPMAVPEQTPCPVGRNGPRALLGGDLPRLHAGMPVLPGRHDHPSGARAVHHDDRRHGRDRHQAVRLRGGRPAVALVRRPQRDRRGGQGAGGPLRGHEHLALAAVDPGRRVQHHAGQRVLPQRPALRPDLRARRAAPSGCAG